VSETREVVDWMSYRKLMLQKEMLCLKQEKLGAVLKFIRIENKILVAMASRH